MVPLLDQFYYFALTILIGAISGFCYDLYKVTRGTLRLRRIGTALGDVLFWVILTAVVFILLLAGNWGEVRLYVLIGLTIGAVLYLNLLSRHATLLLQFTFKLINRICKAIIDMFKFIWKVFCLPFKIIFLAVAIPLSFGKKVLKLVIVQPVRKLAGYIRRRLSSIFPIFEYKDDK